MEYGIIERMKMHIQGCNKYMTDEYLDTLNVLSLLRLTHPTDRKQYAAECEREGLITKEERETKVTAKGWDL